MTSHLWIDASAGVAGDMLLGALVDAGADLAEVQAAVDAVLPDTVRLTRTGVMRAGLRACKVEVQPHRSWADIRTLLERADLADAVRDRAVGAFTLLAEAEARVHDVGVDDVHFHEVGSWDSVADIVGVASAVHLLDVTTASAGPVALGSGTVRTLHGVVSVPAPATLELAKGWQVTSTGEGELATPTGMALVRALAGSCAAMPPMRITGSGSGAGTKDFPGRANVVRVIVGEQVTGGSGAGSVAAEAMWVLEANVDDLDPRLWPGVLASLLEARAADAWLTPILMKKGRPAHTLSVLCTDADRAPLREIVLTHTTSLGVREHSVERHALGRSWRTVTVRGHAVRIKVSTDSDGTVVHATPEFEDVRAAAAAAGIPERVVLTEAVGAAQADESSRAGSTGDTND